MAVTLLCHCIWHWSQAALVLRPQEESARSAVFVARTALDCTCSSNPPHSLFISRSSRRRSKGTSHAGYWSAAPLCTWSSERGTSGQSAARPVPTRSAHLVHLHSAASLRSHSGLVSSPIRLLFGVRRSSRSSSSRSPRLAPTRLPFIHPFMRLRTTTTTTSTHTFDVCDTQRTIHTNIHRRRTRRRRNT